MLGTWTLASYAALPENAVLCAALARTLSSHGKRVLLVDLCPTCPMLDLALGVSERVLYTLSDVAFGSVSAAHAFLSPERGEGKTRAKDENILFLPIEAGAALSETQVKEALFAAYEASGADVALFLAEEKMLSAARAASDGLILLTAPHSHALRSARVLSEKSAPSGFLLTDFVPTKEGVRRIMSPTELADFLGIPMLGILPQSGISDVSLRPLRRDFLCAVENLAGRLCGAQIPLLRGIPIEGMRRRTYFER